MKTTRKNFGELCKMFRILSAVIEVFMIVGSAMYLINAIWLLTIGNSSIRLGSISFHAPFISVKSEQFAAEVQILCLIAMVTLFLVCLFAKKIFSKLEKSETPFIPELPAKIYAIGLTLIIGTGASIILRVISGLVAGFNNADVNADSLYNAGLDSSVMIIGAFLLALSYVFEHGLKLQQESDETL